MQDDLILASLIQSRLNAVNAQHEELVEMTIAQLERDAIAKIKLQASTKTVLAPRLRKTISSNPKRL
jgi:hypothetical protein